MSEFKDAKAVLAGKRRILVFSGAGISTESGIPDFRGPDGIWTKVDPDDFHISRYRTRADLRIKGWQMHVNGERWGARSGVVPNRGHEAVVRLWENYRLSGVVTQNVDGLHQAAGLPDEAISELHGNVKSCHCIECGATWPTEVILQRVDAGEEDPHCDRCGGVIKTSVVMFGEMLDPETMSRAFMFLSQSDAILVLGSTVAVSPASDVVLRAALQPMPIVIVNKGETEADHLAAARIDGAIGDHLPALVEAILD
ncbi:MAG: Sir2 family NAD-dependent protein deacetylase [Acidimicrobiia bacterium]